MKIPSIDKLKPDYSYAKALTTLGITYTSGANNEAKFEEVFPYIYYERKTENESFPIPGIFDTSSTMFVSALGDKNILAPGAKELVIIGPPYEKMTVGSHVDRLIRCLLNELGDKFVFTGETNFDISFIALNQNESKLGGYASLLLTNQLQVIEVEPKAKQGTIKAQILADLKKEFLDAFGINSKAKTRVEILKEAKRLAICVKTSKESVKGDEDIVRIISDKTTKTVSLREIGFSAALGIYSGTTPLKSFSARQVETYIHKSKSLDIDTFLTVLQTNGSESIVDHLLTLLTF